jgi:uncharacterized protein involved in exopolysaccharide biosynthesis
LIYTFVVPPQWKATATIITVLPTELGGGAGQSLASALSPTSPDPLQVLEGILTSRRSVDLIMERSKLRRRDIERGLKTERRQKQALLTLSWEDYDAKRALSVVQGALDGVKLMQRDVGFTAASLQAKYLEDSVHEQEGKLRKAESALADFEKSMKAPINPADPTSVGAYLKQKLDLQLQLGTVEQSIKIGRSQARLVPAHPDLPTMIPNTKPFRDKLIQLQYNLDVAQTTLGPLAPKVVALKREIDVTRQTLNEEISRYLQSVDVNLDANIATLEATRLTTKYQLDIASELAESAPREAVELARLAREVVILGDVSTNLRSKWEEAKIAADVDQVKWSVLEGPFIEDVPTNKHFVRNTAIGAIIGFLIGSVILNIRSRRAAQNASEQGMHGSAA